MVEIGVNVCISRVIQSEGDNMVSFNAGYNGKRRHILTKIIMVYTCKVRYLKLFIENMLTIDRFSNV